MSSKESNNKIKNPLRFLYYTGFWYRGLSKSAIGKILRLARSIILTSLCSMVFVATVYHTIVNCKFNTVNASYPITCCWQLQQILNIIIIHRWQQTGILTQELLPILRLPNSIKIQRRCQRICLLLLLIIVLFLISVLIASKFNNDNSEMFSYKKIFNSIPVLYIVGRSIGWYMILVFLVVNYYFHASTGILCQELECFNKRFKTEFQTSISFDETDGKTGCEMARKMHGFYNEHLELSNRIRSLDKIFNVYTLSNASTAIPCTVFTLWTLFLRISSASWIHVLLSLIELFFCLVSLSSLLINPSRIRVLVRQTRALIFSSTSLWQLYVPKICDISRLFISHLDQDELGISVYGLLTISKSLTLSIVSGIATLLIFLVELNGSQETKGFGAAISRLLD